MPNLWRGSYFTIFGKEIDDIWKIFNLSAGKGQWKDKQIPFCVKRKIQNSELENPVGGRDTSNVIFARPLLHYPVRYGTFFVERIFLLDEFWARFNVSMNNQNVSNRAISTKELNRNDQTRTWGTWNLVHDWGERGGCVDRTAICLTIRRTWYKWYVAGGVCRAVMLRAISP